MSRANAINRAMTRSIKRGNTLVVKKPITLGRCDGYGETSFSTQHLRIAYMNTESAPDYVYVDVYFGEGDYRIQLTELDIKDDEDLLTWSEFLDYFEVIE